MILLSADTSTSINTVAVTSGDAILAESIVEAGRRHSERLLETVRYLLDEAQIAIRDIECLAIATGPGSFTGLRVGVATFKGLAAGLALPLVGVPTLDAMSRLFPMAGALVCPVLDARMREVFASAYDFSRVERLRSIDACVCSVDDFVSRLERPALFLGPGATLYRERILERMPDAQFAPALHNLPRASAVAAEALMRLQHGDSGDAARVAPVYLRKSQAELNRAAIAQKR